MAVLEVGREQAQRQKWLTVLVVVGLSVTALIVGLTYWGSASRIAAPMHPPPSPAADVNQQLSGYTFTRSDQGRPVFTVHAARTVSYQQSKSTTLEDVTVELFGPKGDRGDILRTQRCDYNSASGNFLTSGPVQMELNAHSSDIPGSGLRGKHRVYLETSKVAYSQRHDLAETDEPVKFHMGPASGTARGLAYAISGGWLELKHDVAVQLEQGSEKSPQPPIHLTAAALRYDKERGELRLTGPVEVTQSKRSAHAEAASVNLDDHNRVSRVNLTGHASASDLNPLRNVELSADRVQGGFDAVSGHLHHITAQDNVVGESRGKAGVSHLTAQQCDIELVGEHPQPLRGVATGDVRINLETQAVLTLPDQAAGGRGPEKKSLTAATVQFGFRPDTHGLRDAQTLGPGTLIFTPADPKTGGKVITAGQFLMAFDTRSRIESLRGLAPTKVLFVPAASAPAGSTAQESQADSLNAVFDPGTQTLREVRQTGNFQYRDGDRRGSADDAHYDAATQLLLLLGRPQVWDPSSRVKSQRMTIDMRTNTSTGEGNVQATHLQTPAPGASPASSAPLPTNVLADKMVSARASQTIHYEGHVRAWQGSSVVESTALDVYRAQKRVSSGADVVTSFLQPPAAAGGKVPMGLAASQGRPVTVAADFLEYFDQGRRARYHGNVHMTTESTKVQSDRLDVYLSQGASVEGSEVDHAEADGHVRVTQPGRLGTGNHAEYFAGPGKIVLTGGPPVVVDQEQGSTTGRSLTFFIHDDRLFVDGGDKTPSLSKHRVAP